MPWAYLGFEYTYAFEFGCQRYGQIIYDDVATSQIKSLMLHLKYLSLRV